MVDCYIGLGSNLDDPAAHVNLALLDLQRIPHTQRKCYSSLYETLPVGPAEQAHYINAVALLETTLSPDRLLSELQLIENQHGRRRQGQRWGPRTLDLDILLYGDLQIAQADLIVPHKEMANRAFVLVPLAELNAELSIPKLGQVAALQKKVDLSEVTKIT